MSTSEVLTPRSPAANSASCAVGTDTPDDRPRCRAAALHADWRPENTAEVQRLVKDAYLTILRREPDVQGLAYYTEQLSASALAPLDLYHNLVNSEEFAQQQLLTNAASLADGSSFEGAMQAGGRAEDHTQARDAAKAIFEMVLKRQPDDAALESYSQALATGALQPLSMTSELLASQEFGVQAAQHETVARHLAQTVIATLMGRDPGMDAVGAYSSALQNGYSLAEFLQELLSSPEFAQRMGRGTEPVASKAATPLELGRLAEGLIAEHLTAIGCHLAPPPQSFGYDMPVSNERMRSMLQTLSMLARSQQC